MAYEGLRIARMILFRAFWIMLGLLLFYTVMLCAWRDAWLSLVIGYLHFPSSADVLMAMAVRWLAVVKFCTIFLLLVPALAIHWTLKSLEKRT